MPVKIYCDERRSIDGQLTNCFESKHTFQQLCDRKEDKIYVQAVITRLLKNNKVGYEYKTLYDLTCENFIQKVELDIFKYVLSELIRKQYIAKENKMYIYIP